MDLPVCQLYHDLPGINSVDFSNPEMDGSDTDFAIWTSIDSHYEPFCNTRPPADDRRFCSYDTLAHGFGQAYPPNMAGDAMYQLGLANVWGEVDQYRNVRYVSPTTSGMTTSSTASSISEYTWSPDVPRSRDQPISFPPSECHRRPFMRPVEAISHLGSNWTPTPSCDMHCNLKELLVTPEPPPGDGLMGDKDTILVKQPEELELSDPLASPTDSGLGLSIHEDDIKGEDEEENDDDDVPLQESDDDPDFDPHGTGTRHHSNPGRPFPRHPRRSTTTTTTSSFSTRAVIDPGARVQKPTHGRRPSLNNSRSKAKRQPINRLTHQAGKSFPCTFHHYGCTATFASKNEWKRHVSSQHLQLGFFRCDMGSCSPTFPRTRQRGYNDFNRKDLFTQHCRRMHAPWAKKGDDEVSKKEKDDFEKQMEDIRKRCWVDMRKAPEKSRCGFCGQTFVDGANGPGKKDGSVRSGWEERMEHVGRHFEKDRLRVEEEEVDEGLREWAIREGVVVEGKGKSKGAFYLAGFEPTDNDEGGSRRGRRRSARTMVPVDQEEVDELVTVANRSDGPDSVKDEDAEGEEDEDDDDEDDGEEEDEEEGEDEDDDDDGHEDVDVDDEEDADAEGEEDE